MAHLTSDEDNARDNANGDTGGLCGVSPPQAVPGGDEVVPVVNALALDTGDFFQEVVYSQDWHPADHCSFASNHEGAQPFTTRELPGIGAQEMWPVHCVQGSPGAEFHPDLKIRSGRG